MKEKDESTKLLELLDLFEGKEIEEIDQTEFYEAQKKLGIANTVNLEDLEDYRLKRRSDEKLPAFIKDVLALFNKFEYKKHYDTEEELVRKEKANLDIAKAITDLHLKHELEVENLRDVEDAMSDVKEIVNIANRGSKNMVDAVLITMVKREFGVANIKTFTEKYKQIANEMYEEKKKKDLENSNK